jgi:putative flippase GtrA
MILRKHIFGLAKSWAIGAHLKNRIFYKFTLIGLLCASIEIIVFFVLNKISINIFISALVAYLCPLPINFILNSTFNFRAKVSIASFTKHMLVIILLSFINSFLTYAASLLLPEPFWLYAKIPAIIILFFISFFLARKFVYIK